MTTKTITYGNNKQLTYTNETLFKVQVGRGAKGSYKDFYTFIGDLDHAVYTYRAINIGYGYKKRLVVADGPVLVRARSSAY